MFSNTQWSMAAKRGLSLLVSVALLCSLLIPSPAFANESSPLEEGRHPDADVSQTDNQTEKTTPEEASSNDATEVGTQEIEPVNSSDAAQQPDSVNPSQGDDAEVVIEEQDEDVVLPEETATPSPEEVVEPVASNAVDPSTNNSDDIASLKTQSADLGLDLIPAAEPNQQASIRYRGHVQKIGWQPWVSDGDIAGTWGQSLRVEALELRLAGVSGGIEASGHVQRIGWQPWKYGYCGTSGRGLRIEAMKLRLTGEAAQKYDIWYRGHVQKVGWQPWVKNGGVAGTNGRGLRIEALQVCLRPKNANMAHVEYHGHVQKIGWQDWVSDGVIAGTSGRGLRVEALELRLNGVGGSIEASGHVQKIGWQPWKSGYCGTSGRGLRVEAMKLRLTGEAAQKYDIWYRVHVQTFGWQGWKKGPDMAGTSGKGKRLEAMQVRLLPKGVSPTPDMTIPDSSTIAPTPEPTPAPTPKPTSNAYTIRYDANGGSGSMANTTAKRDTYVDLRESTFERDGYVFVGWSTGRDGNGSWYLEDESVRNLGATGETVTLYAQWLEDTPWTTWESGSTYTIFYDANGGDGNMWGTIASCGEKTELEACRFSRDGFYFVCWSTKKDGLGKWIWDQQEVVDLAPEGESITLYAQWFEPYPTSDSSNTYTIVYDANDGSGTTSSDTVFTNSNVLLRTLSFTRENYAFEGWNTKEDGTGQTYANEASVCNLTTAGESVTLYAQWRRQSYTVQYCLNTYSDEQINNQMTQVVNRGENVTLQDCTTTVQSKSFDGWNTKRDGTGTAYAAQSSVCNIANDGETVTLYAQWQTNVYTIHFDSNGGTGNMSSQTANRDANITLNANTFTRSGFNFSGWNTKYNGTGTSYGNAASVCNLAGTGGSITLYAQWTQQTYTIWFFGNGGQTSSGSGLTSQIMNRNTYVTLNSNPFSRTRHTFKEWNTKSDGTGTSYANGTRVYNLTDSAGSYLYAQWTPYCTYLRFNPNGGKYRGSNHNTSTTSTFSPHNTNDGTDVRWFYNTAHYNYLPSFTSSWWTRDGYVFTGLWTAPSGGTMVYGADGRCNTSASSYWNTSNLSTHCDPICAVGSKLHLPEVQSQRRQIPGIVPQHIDDLHVLAAQHERWHRRAVVLQHGSLQLHTLLWLQLLGEGRL